MMGCNHSLYAGRIYLLSGVVKFLTTSQSMTKFVTKIRSTWSPCSKKTGQLCVQTQCVQ